MMKRISAILLSLILTVGLHAQESPGKGHSKLDLDCRSCHICDVPTKDDPCLVMCPRQKILTVFQKAEQTPELIVIDELSSRYGPVYFSHRLHAQMSNMSGGCQGCHHFNTIGPILKCNSCHESTRKRENISLPDLEGAFHRQCMDCHREWSHETGCSSCHVPIEDVKGTKKEEFKKQITGKIHPTVSEPTQIIYQTNSDKGKLVTFYHADHTKKFALNCINCHKQESCTKCHDVNKTSDVKVKIVDSQKTFEEHHKLCISCHGKQEDCSRCHSDKKLEPFEHAKNTGWALNKYHIKLACTKCHGNKMPYRRLDNRCINCHGDWSTENFKHSITGLKLDETHSEFGCEECHLNKNFAVKPSCAGCHENFAYPKQKPGKIISK
jgi:hypothetical protein